MIENNKNEIEVKDNVVELSGSDKLSRKKRRIGAFALSAAAVTAVCISIAATAARVPEEAAPADLSEYRYSSEETAASAAGEPAARRSAEIPRVTLPEAVPEGYSTYSASVNSISALGASPAVYDVTIVADGETCDVTAGGTVEDAIDRSGIELGRYDIITPDLDTPLSDDTVITIQRVQYVKITTQRSIPADTEYIEDDTLPLGETMVVTEGCDGVLKRVYKVKRVDGEDVKVKLISETVSSEPVNTVIANGTYEEDITYYEDPEEEFEEESAEEYSDDYTVGSVQTEYRGEGTPASQVKAVSQFDVPENLILDENNVPLNYTQALHGKSCAYTAGEGALMSTGKAVQQGYVAVNPDIIPYGTKMYIVADDGEVYGYAIAADTGGSVGRNDILVDLFMWSYDECIQWGAKNVTIYILPDEE